MQSSLVNNQLGSPYLMTKGFKCHRCGNPGHNPAQCKFLKAKCHGCGKIGHLKKVCRSSNPQEAVKAVQDTPASAHQQYDLYHLEDATLPRTAENHNNN